MSHQIYQFRHVWSFICYFKLFVQWSSYLTLISYEKIEHSFKQPSEWISLVMHKLIPHFNILSHKCYDFRKKKVKIKCEFWLSLKGLLWNISHYDMNTSYNETYKKITIHFIPQSGQFYSDITETYRDFQNRPHQFVCSLKLRKCMHRKVIPGHSIIVGKEPKPWLNMYNRSRFTKWKNITIPQPKTDNIYWE